MIDLSFFGGMIAGAAVMLGMFALSLVCEPRRKAIDCPAMIEIHPDKNYVLHNGMTLTPEGFKLMQEIEMAKKGHETQEYLDAMIVTNCDVYAGVVLRGLGKETMRIETVLHESA